LLIPANPIVSLNKVRWNGLTKYRVWKPLGLLVVAGLTPPDWEVTLIDENLDHPDYGRFPKPDLVGVTAFTSQAPRAYEVAAMYRAMGVPVVMGGIHTTFCREEALSMLMRGHGEAESVWGRCWLIRVTMPCAGCMRVASAAWTQSRFPVMTCWRQATLSEPFKPRAAVR
jgi:hypothetical protein